MPKPARPLPPLPSITPQSPTEHLADFLELIVSIHFEGRRFCSTRAALILAARRLRDQEAEIERLRRLVLDLEFEPSD